MDRTLKLNPHARPALSDADVYKAMERLGAYVDITPADFRAIYEDAWTIARQKLLGEVTAGDMMSAPVVTIPEDMPLREAVALMGAKGVSGAPVLDGEGRPVGLLSEKDVARAAGCRGRLSPMALLDALLGAGVPVDVFGQPASAVMTKGMFSVDVHATLGQMLELMQAKGVNRLPVTEDGHLIGIVSRTDILNFFLRQR